MPIIFVLLKCLGIPGSNHCFPMVAFEPCPLLLSFAYSRMTTVLKSESHSTESFQVSGKVPSLHMFYQQNISLELSDPFWYEMTLILRKAVGSGESSSPEETHRNKNSGPVLF